jgi:hypothetical protein
LWRSPALPRAFFASGGAGYNALFGSRWFGFRDLMNSSLKLGTRDRALAASRRDQFPKTRAAPKFHLFRVKPGNAHDKSNWSPVSSDHDLFALCFVNAFVKARLFYTDDFHRISSVVLCAGLCLIARTITSHPLLIDVVKHSIIADP